MTSTPSNFVMKLEQAGVYIAMLHGVQVRAVDMDTFKHVDMHFRQDCNWTEHVQCV